MATTALLTENFKFLLLFFKSKDVMIFNGLIALGTVAGQTAYALFAFHCPCSSSRNHLYGLATIGVPAFGLLLVGIMMNRSTWDLVSECRLRKCRKLSAAAAFALLGSIAGRPAVAPLTWVIISLLHGQAYTCALSEFVDPKTLEGFPTGQGSEVMAKFPCPDIPAELQSFWPHIERQLKYESQLIGLLLMGGMALTAFLVLCVKHCTSPLSHQQEDYWSQYRSNEKTLFKRTACAHARIVAAHNVRSFFGFVALEQEEKEELMEHQNAAGPVCSTNWDRVTGVYLYREKNGLPLYSRLNKWATYSLENNTEALEKEMETLG